MTAADKEAKETKKNGVKDGSLMLVPKGIPNLGNTCFFNSVMQCLMNTHPLLLYFQRIKSTSFISNPMEYSTKVHEVGVRVPAVEIPLPDVVMPLVKSFHKFAGEYRTSDYGTNPRGLFDQIARKATRFRGWQQQDAHELLRYLLDGLRQEEIGRFKRAFHNFYEIESDVALDKDQTLLCKAFIEGPAKPILDAVFGGVLQQTIVCSKCHHVSVTFEPFLDLSLPLLKVRNVFAESEFGTSNCFKNDKPSKHQQKKDKRKSSKKKKMKRGMQNRNKSVDVDEVDETEDAPEGGPTEANDQCQDEEEADEKRDDKMSVDETLPTESASYSSDHASVFKEMDNSEYDASKISVVSALKQFTDPEILEASNAYRCEKCCAPKRCDKNQDDNQPATIRYSVEASKRYLILKPPLILTIHLKRFEIQGRGRAKKFRGHVNFGLKLDLAPFCCKNVKRIDSTQKNIWYSLYGIVSHSGDLSSGHYIAYVRARPQMEKKVKHLFDRSFFDQPNEISKIVSEKCQGLSLEDEGKAENIHLQNPDDIFDSIASKSKWYYVSDSSVSCTTERRALEAEAFILFYERIY